MKRAAVTCALALLWLAGSPTRASAEKPKATVYAFFATWCVPCRVELPQVQQLYDRYRARGVRVVLVSEDEPSTSKQVPPFLARYKITVPWVLDNESTLLERYNPSANVPFTVVLDASGQTVYSHAGFEPGDERLLESAIVRALAKTAAATTTGRPSVRVDGSTQGLGVWRTSRFDDAAADGKLKAAAGRVEVTGYTDSYHAIVRVDGATLDRSGDGEDVRVERFRLGANLGALKIQLGDGYTSFGHGVSLSLRKVDPLGLDTSLRGLRVDAALPRTQIKLLAGWTNPQNLDPIEIAVVDDTNDLITGAEVKVKASESISLAPYGLFIRAEGAADDGSDVDWALGGMSTTADLGALSLAGEFAAGRRKGMLLDDETTWAGYMSASWRLSRNLTALVDVKAYRRWAIGRPDRTLLYHEPPSLERPDQEVAGTSDAIGSRARVEATLGKTVILANALAYRFGRGGMDPIDGDLALHGYAGIERRFRGSGSASLQAGYRDETRADGSNSLSMWHVDVDFAWPLTNVWAATFKWNHRSETKDLVFSELSFVRGLGVAGLSWSGKGTVSLLYGYSTEDSTTPTHFPAAEVLVRLPRSSFARLFVGRLSGGRVCVSGSCRDVPPFSGARLDLVMRFR